MAVAFKEESKKHEQLLVGFMWSNPQLYKKFKYHNISNKTFTVPMWWFYYKLGEMMWDNGVRSFDEETVISFLDSRLKSNKKLLEKYNEHGGYETIGIVKEFCSKDKNNEEYHLSEVQKYEALRVFLKNGLIDPKNDELLKKFINMPLKSVQMYFNHKYKDAFSNINSGQVEIVDLIDEDIYEDIKEMDKGVAMGIPFFHAPKLTKLLKGWQLGNLTYLVMPSGVGKSTMVRSIFLMTLITQNKKGIAFLNEEGVRAWRISLLAIVASYILKKKLNRDKIFEGNFSDRTKDVLNEAADWLLENRPDMLKLIVLKKYRFEDVLNYAEYYKALGANYMILDTFKQDGTVTDMQRWQVISQNSQELYDLVKEENLNMGCLATLQLKIGKVFRFLDHDCVGKSKEVVEVAGATMLGRLLFKDEYDGEKNEIFAFNLKKDEFDGSWYKDKYVLDPKKQYIIFYIAKNRFGSTNRQLIYEINYDFNELIEVAYAEEKPESSAY